MIYTYINDLFIKNKSYKTKHYDKEATKRLILHIKSFNTYIDFFELFHKNSTKTILTFFWSNDSKLTKTKSHIYIFNTQQ